MTLQYYSTNYEITLFICNAVVSVIILSLIFSLIQQSFCLKRRIPLHKSIIWLTLLCMICYLNIYIVHLVRFSIDLWVSSPNKNNSSNIINSTRFELYYYISSEFCFYLSQFSLFSMFLSRLYHSFKHSVYRVSSIIFALYSILLMTYLIVGAAITYVLTFKIVSSVPSDQIKKDLIAIELFQIILQTVIGFSILSIFISRLFKLVISQYDHGTPRRFTESLNNYNYNYNRTQDSEITIEPDIHDHDHDQDAGGTGTFNYNINNYNVTLQNTPSLNGMRSIPETPLTVGTTDTTTTRTNNTTTWIHPIARPSDANINDSNDNNVTNNNNSDNNISNESTNDDKDNTNNNMDTDNTSNNKSTTKKHSKTSWNGLIFGHTKSQSIHKDSYKKHSKIIRGNNRRLLSVSRNDSVFDSSNYNYINNYNTTNMSQDMISGNGMSLVVLDVSLSQKQVELLDIVTRQCLLTGLAIFFVDAYGFAFAVQYASQSMFNDIWLTRKILYFIGGIMDISAVYMSFQFNNKCYKNFCHCFHQCIRNCCESYAKYTFTNRMQRRLMTQQV